MSFDYKHVNQIKNTIKKNQTNKSYIEEVNNNVVLLINYVYKKL